MADKISDQMVQWLDHYLHVISDPAKYKNFNYKFQILFPSFKRNGDGEFSVGQNDLLSISVLLDPETG